MKYEEDPIELKSGELGCPRCFTQLVNGTVPYFVFGTRVGEFDGLLCEICRYGVLSEKGYEDSGKKIKKLCILEVSFDNSIDIHNLYNEPIEGSKISIDKISISKLIPTKNNTEQYTVGEIMSNGENITNYTIEQPIITIHNKNKLRM